MALQKKILVVDDEKAIRDMIAEAFTAGGYKVYTAENAEDALDVALREGINVYFLDLKLPGMDGLELCRRVRWDNPMAVVYAITGYASLFEIQKCREAGFDDYFTKPVRLDVLFKSAETAFEKLSRWRSGPS